MYIVIPKLFFVDSELLEYSGQWFLDLRQQLITMYLTE